MAGAASLAEKIQPLLAQLPQSALLSLRRATDAAKQSGSSDPLFEILNDVLKNLGFANSARRQPNPSRYFFDPAEAFLVTDKPHEKMAGQIWRGSLEPIWKWIEDSVAKTEARAFRTLLAEQFKNPLFDDEAASENFTQIVIPLIEDRLEQALQTPETRRKFCNHIGGEYNLSELQDLVCIISHRTVLKNIETTLPPQLDLSVREHVAQARLYFEDLSAIDVRLPFYGAVIFQSRLADKMQLPQWTVACVGDADIRAIEASPFAALVDIAISQTVQKADLCIQDLKKPSENNFTSQHAKNYALRCRHLRASIGLDEKSSDWLDRISNARLRLSDALGGELSQIFQLIRRNIKPLRGFGTQTPYPPDEFDLSRLCFLIEVMMMVKNYSEEFVLNETLTRVYKECGSYLETAIEVLQEESRQVTDTSRRKIVLAYSEAALRVSQVWFGEKHTELLKKGFDLHEIPN